MSSRMNSLCCGGWVPLFPPLVRIPAALFLLCITRLFVGLDRSGPVAAVIIVVSQSMGLAAAESVYEHTRKYVKERKAFGKPLEALQVRAHLS